MLEGLYCSAVESPLRSRLRLVLSASKPASGMPFEGIGLFLVIFLRISVIPDAVVCAPVGGLLVEGSGSLWSGHSRLFRGGMSSNSPRLVVVKMIGLCRVAKDVERATLHSGVSWPFHTRWLRGLE